MKIFGYNISIRKAKEREPVSSFVNLQRYSTMNKPAMTLSAVYRCVNVISESVAQLPLDTYRKDDKGFKTPYTNHSSYELIREFPNPAMTRFTFMKVLVSSVLLTGNGYAYIDRDDFGNALSLQYVPSDRVTITYINVDGIPRMRYEVTGFKYLVEPSDMIHILNFTYDGVKGVSTLTHARNTIILSSSAETSAKEFFSSGANVNGILSLKEGRLRTGQKEDIKKEWGEIVANGGIGVLEGNMEYQPISIKPADMQMLQTRQFNVIDICRFFGVSPVKAFDLSKSSYSTVEATQLAFLTDTLAPLLENIELEFKRKVFRPSERKYIEVKFDTTTLLRADKAAQASYMKTMYEMGALTPNEVRRTMDMPRVEDGDKPLVNNAMVPLDLAANKTNPV